MKHYYFFIPHSEPLDRRLRLYEFTAGESKRDKARLEWMMQVAGQRGDYFSIRDQQAITFRQMLSESLYPDAVLAWHLFLLNNVIRCDIDFLFNLKFKQNVEVSNYRKPRFRRRS